MNTIDAQILHLSTLNFRKSIGENLMKTPYIPSVVMVACCSVLAIGTSACSSRAEPSCKDATALETVRQGVENTLLSSQLFGDAVQVTKIEGTPSERMQFGVVCRALLDLSGVDVGRLDRANTDGSKKIVKPFQVRVTYTVDAIDGELVTKWDSSNLFNAVMLASALVQLPR